MGGGTQVALTLGIVLLMVGFVVAGFFTGATELIPYNMQSDVGVADFASGLVAVLFTYMGWTTVVYIASEVENPRKNIPRALIGGIAVIVLLYMAINYVFLSALPVHEIADRINVASLVADRLWGVGATRLIAVMIFIAILSSLNSTVLSGPRIYQAMGEDRYLWPALAKKDKTHDTPYVALWVQAVWSILLMLSGTFNQLLTIVVGAILLFSILSGSISIKIVLKNSGGFEWKTLAVLIPTIIYLLLCCLILINILYTSLMESLIGFIIILLSYPFYRHQRYQSNTVYE
jgi:APA family basic amino acid/polyamine antiporter